MKYFASILTFFALSSLALAAQKSGEQLLKNQCEQLGKDIRYYDLKTSEPYAPNRYIVKGCRVNGPYFAVLIQNKPTVRHGVQYGGTPEDLKPQVLLLHLLPESLYNEILPQMNGNTEKPKRKKVVLLDEPKKSYIADQSPLQGKDIPGIELREDADFKPGNEIKNQNAQHII